MYEAATEMMLRSVIYRGLVPGGGGHLVMENLKVSTLDCSLSVLVKCLSNVKLTEPIQYCSIKELEVNQELSRMKLDTSQHLNKCVKHILQKDIQVPKLTLMLNKNYARTTVKRKIINIPDEVKMNRWGPNEEKLISDNMDSLLTGIRQKKNKDAVLESLFTPSMEKWHNEKTNIIGCYLGQGLPDLRLPCETFLRAKRLFNSDLDRRVVFTENDDKRIMEYMSNEANTDSSPYASLSRMLGLRRESIRTRYVRILRPGSKKGDGEEFTVDENREIMQTIFKENKNALNHNYSELDQVWIKLSTKLNRRPFNLYQHWEDPIRPHIMMFEHGMENVDFRPILIDYCVDNNIIFCNEANWTEIAEDVRFRGTTPHYLRRLYKNLMSNFKTKNPGIRDSEVTSLAIQSYLAKSGRKKKPRKKNSNLFEDYLVIKNSLI